MADENSANGKGPDFSAPNPLGSREMQEAPLDFKRSVPQEPIERSNDAFDGFVPPTAVKPTFTSDEALARSGNYALTFGLGGSGKSTFHSYLLRYLEEGGRFNARMKIPRLNNGEVDEQTRILLNQWRHQWKTGRFVEATGTTEAHIREIIYSVTPNRGVRDELNFGMVEVSGELLRTVMGGSTGRQTLPEAIHHLVANANVNLILLIMVHPETPHNDLLFTNLMDYVTERFPGRLPTLGLGVIIANPDLALEKLIEHTGGSATRADDPTYYNPSPSPFSHYRRLEDEAVIEYLKVMAPGILNRFRSWESDRKMITPLRLGDIELDPQTKRPFRLIHQDDEHISKIFAWLYKGFLGKELGPTWYQRMFSNLNEDL